MKEVICKSCGKKFPATEISSWIIQDGAVKKCHYCPIEDTVKRLVFLNISNHPSSKWSAEQIKAAQYCAVRDSEIIGEDNFTDFMADVEIIDISFPQIPAELMELDLIGLLTSFVNSSPFVSLPKKFSCMIQGEFTASYLLINHFRSEGCSVYAATTEREVVEEDGIKKSIFKFIRFRAYQTASLHLNLTTFSND